MAKTIHTLSEDSSNKKSSRRWWRRNKEKDLKTKQKYRQANLDKYLRDAAYYRAKKNGIPFSLTRADISVPEVCPILKTSFEYGTMYAASLDRIDPNKGYTPENVWVISRLANVMKSNATTTDLRRFAEWVNQSKP